MKSVEYQTLYRAYRPKFFRDIVGQEPIVTTLMNQIESGKIAHAYLFCGSRGTGKTSTAKVFARAINCQDSSAGAEPCGACESCRQLLEESSMDVVEIDAASNNGVDEIRELRDKIKYPPTVGKYKVYIIDEVHMLSSGAFNAFLKTLEEPPVHAVFILATTEPQKLPATILSRCQRYDFKRFSAQVIVKKLKEALPAAGKRVEEGALYDIARASEGGMRDAWNLLEMCLAYGDRGAVDERLVREVLGVSDRGFLFDFSQALLFDDVQGAMRMISEALSGGRDAAVFAREVASHLRALMLAQSVEDDLEDLLDCTREDAARYRDQAQEATPEKLRRAMELFIESDADMRYAAQPRVVLELATVKACHPEKERSIEALEQRIAQLEKRLEGGTVSAPQPKIEKKGTQPTPEPPKKAEEAKPAIAPAQGISNWEQALASIQASDKSLYPLIAHAVFKGETDSGIALEIPKKYKVYLNFLLQADKKTLLETRLETVYGRKIAVQIAVEGEGKPVVSPKGLEEIYEVFDRENVSVEDDE